MSCSPIEACAGAGLVVIGEPRQASRESGRRAAGERRAAGRGGPQGERAWRLNSGVKRARYGKSRPWPRVPGREQPAGPISGR